MAKIARVKWKATNIALGQYWFLLLLHGFIPPGPGQYRVLLPWLEEDIAGGTISPYYHLLLDWGVQYGSMMCIDLFLTASRSCISE